MPSKKNSRLRKSITRHQQQKPSVNQSTCSQITPVSQFVREFVRRRILPSQFSQSDLCWRPGSNVSHNINLLPQSTRIIHQSKRKFHSVFGNKNSLIYPSDKSGLTRSFNEKQITIPRRIPSQLHSLWIGYFQSLFPVRGNQNFYISENQLETILRMSLVGAKLKILRSLTSSLAGQEGIVVMETKNIFLMSLGFSTSKKCPDQLSIKLTPVIKFGSVFVLHYPQNQRTNTIINDNSNQTTCSNSILLDGDRLAHRPIDRATRKWRRSCAFATTTSTTNSNSNIFSKSENLFTDILLETL